MSTAIMATAPVAETSAGPLGQRFVRYKRPLALAVAVLYLAMISPYWFITSDSALYLMLGRNIAHGEGYTLDGRPHAYVPPGYPLIVAGLTKIGLGSMLGLNIAMTLLGLASLWLAYRMLRAQTTEPLALAAVLTVAFSSDMYAQTSMQLSDIPFMLLVCGGLWCYVRGLQGGRYWLEIGSLCLIGCCWMRVVGVPLAGAAAVGLLLQKRQVGWPRLLLNVALVAIGLLATAALFYARYKAALVVHRPESYAPAVTQLAVRPPDLWIWAPLRHFYQSGAYMFRLFTGQWVPAWAGCLLLWSAILIGMFRYAVSKRQAACVLAAVVYMGAILMLSPLEPRYLLPLFPLLILYYLEGATRIFSWLPKIGRFAPQLALGMAVILMLTNIPKDLGLAYRMHVKHFAQDAELGASIYDIAEYLRQHVPEGEKFVATVSRRELSYLSQAPTLEMGDAPADGVEKELATQSVNTIVVGESDCPSWNYSHAVRLIAEQGGGPFEVIYENKQYKVYRRAGLASHLAKGQTREEMKFPPSTRQ